MSESNAKKKNIQFQNDCEQLKEDLMRHDSHIISLKSKIDELQRASITKDPTGDSAYDDLQKEAIHSLLFFVVRRWSWPACENRMRKPVPPLENSNEGHKKLAASPPTLRAGCLIFVGVKRARA